MNRDIKQVYKMCSIMGYEARFGEPIIIDKVNSSGSLWDTIYVEIMRRKLEIAQAEVAQAEKENEVIAYLRSLVKNPLGAKTSMAKGLIKRG